MNEQLWNRLLVLTAITVLIMSAISIGIAWNTSANVMGKLSIQAVLPIFLIALISYLMRAVRFHYFLTQSGILLAFRKTMLVQAIGFALGVTPGRAGEVFKLHLIREHTGIPIAQTAPILVLDRLTEGGGFIILALASAPLLPILQKHLPMPSLIMAGLALMIVFLLTRNYWMRHIDLTHTRFASSRWGQRLLPRLENLWRGMNASFTWRQILGGLVLSVIARFADGVVVLLATELLGASLSLPAAVFILAVSGLSGGFSFLPAGIGVVETTMVSLLALRGVGLSNALAIALLVRLFTLWVWVALGLVLAFILRGPFRQVQFDQSEEC